MNVAVIPARGGSKRIPRKNVREFAGKPMIAHSISCALESRLFERVVVSTDDDEIAAISQKYGAEVPVKRPAALSDDHAGTTEVIAHSIEELRKSGAQPTAVCCIYATAPFIRSEDLRTALQVLESGEWQYVFSAAGFSGSVARAFRQTDAGGLEMLFPDNFAVRSQDLPETLHDAGQFCWGRPEAWTTGARVFEKWSTVVSVPRWRAQDIDSLDDWKHAELLWQVLQTAQQEKY